MKVIGSRGGTSWRSAIGSGAAAVLLTGCGAAPAGPVALATAPDLSRLAPAAATPPADSRACAGAEAVLGHLTTDTARWQPARHPFDRAVARRIAVRADELARQAAQARTEPVRASLQQNASAFAGVTRAMTSRSRRGVDRSITRVRTTYRRLVQLCDLSR